MDQAVLDRLLAAIPAATDAMVILGTQEGVLLADDLIKNSLLLNNPIGFDLRGHIRRAGVMYRLKDLCQRGDLPFDAEFAKMPVGSWHWLDISVPGLRAHIARTDDAEAFPEDTPNKQDARLPNPQGSLFDPPRLTMVEALELVKILYGWLTYGADKDGKLTHLCWSIPASTSNVWLARRNILNDAGRIAPIPEPPPSPDPRTKLRFLDHIKEALDKKDDDKTAS